MTRKLRILLLLMVISLLGCRSTGTTGKEDIPYVDINLLLVPDHLLLSCEYPSPPPIDEYFNLNHSQREKTLMDIYIKGSELNHECNVRIRFAREHQQNVNMLFREKLMYVDHVSKDP